MTLKKSDNLIFSFVLAGAVCIAAPLACRGDQMLSIEWKKGPNLPQGFQDSSGGIIGNTLVTTCGFCQGAESWSNHAELDAVKPDVYL